MEFLRTDYRPWTKREVNAVTSIKCYRCQGTGTLAKTLGLHVKHAAGWGMKPRTAEQGTVREIGNMVS